MLFHELACSSISLHSVPWAYMKYHELACSTVSLHAVPWACMQFHELPCSSFLCLSSSQEFRSACLFWTSNFFSVFSSHCWLLLGLQHKNLLPVLLSKVWHWPLDFLRLGVWRLLWCVCWGFLLWQVHILFTILSYLIISPQTCEPSWCALPPVAAVFLHSTGRPAGCGHPALPSPGGFWWDLSCDNFVETWVFVHNIHCLFYVTLLYSLSF